MSHIIPLLLALLAATGTALIFLDTGTQPEDFPLSEPDTFPVEDTALEVVYRECYKVKRLFGEDSRHSPPPDLSKLTLEIYTRDYRIVYNLSTAAEEIPMSPLFDNQTDMTIYMPGYLNNPSEPTFQEVNNAFHERGVYNVLALGTSSLIGLSTPYTVASTNARYIGEEVGAFVTNITKAGFNASSIYLIGHSLGAQIAGFAGKAFTALTGSKVGRITGLDPAGPCYSDIDSKYRLTSTDADFVDVMHTNAGVYGLDEQIGHADFYPNGGSLQPGCDTQICNHNRAWMLYAETVVADDMPGVSCGSWDQFGNGQCNTSDVSEMGFYCDPSSRGRYYLRTAASGPYGLGTEGLYYVNRGGIQYFDNIFK